MNGPRARLLWYWAPAITWMAVIFFFSSIPSEKIPETRIPNIDKIIHFSEFIILGIFLMRALFNSSANISLITLIAICTGIASLYAVSDEMHQYFVPGRMADVVDFTYDVIGSITGTLLSANVAREGK